MKYTTLFTLLLFAAAAFGQSFNYNDKTFAINSTHRIQVGYPLDKAKLQDVFPNAPILDSLVGFLKKHPYIAIEIDNHTDRDYSYRNMRLDWARARCIADTLIKLGIDSGRITAKGWGNKMPLIPQSKIDKMTRKSQKDSAYALNRRTEVRITSTCYKHETFNWNDTAFYVGSKRKIRVLYDLDKACITEGSKDTLNLVVKLLKKNANLKIEIAVHTDQQGALAHKKILSKAIAQTIANYIIAKGIDSTRIIANGYWDSQPIIPKWQIDTMKTMQKKNHAYQINRRTEVVILKN